MSEGKSLKELGEEYQTYLMINEENIASCKLKLKKAKENGELFEALELQRTLSILYEISRELSETSEHLIKYYN